MWKRYISLREKKIEVQHKFIPSSYVLPSLPSLSSNYNTCGSLYFCSIMDPKERHIIMKLEQFIHLTYLMTITTQTINTLHLYETNLTLMLRQNRIENLHSQSITCSLSSETEIIGRMNKLLNSYESIRIYRVVALVFKIFRQIKVILMNFATFWNMHLVVTYLDFPSDKNWDKWK